MTFLIIIIVVLVFGFFILGNNSEQGKKRKEEVSIPNPETASPKEILKFVDYNTSDVVKQVYQQLIEQGYNIPQNVTEIFNDKIRNGFVIRENYKTSLSLKTQQEKTHNLQSYLETYRFGLTGTFVKHYQKNFSQCVIYDEVVLKKEPNNKFDKNAIKVTYNNLIVGHVPADETNEVSEIMLNKDYKTFVENIFEINGDITIDILIYYKDKTA